MDLSLRLCCKKHSPKDAITHFFLVHGCGPYISSLASSLLQRLFEETHHLHIYFHVLRALNLPFLPLEGFSLSSAWLSARSLLKASHQ